MKLQEKLNENFDGYWFIKNGRTFKKVHLPEGQEHLEYLFDHLSEFGISDSQVQEWENKNGVSFQKYKKRFWDYGDDENCDFLIMALKRGHIRVRFFNDTGIPDGVFSQICYWGNAENPANMLMDHEVEFEGWPICLVDYKIEDYKNYKNVDEVLVDVFRD